jgi:hypothetical protein
MSRANLDRRYLAQNVKSKKTGVVVNYMPRPGDLQSGPTMMASVTPYSINNIYRLHQAHH